jgi:hypothetical protein
MATVQELRQSISRLVNSEYMKRHTNNQNEQYTLNIYNENTVIFGRPRCDWVYPHIRDK